MSARTYERFIKSRGLTAQDVEIVQGVVSGLTSKKIAERLHTDEKTVEKTLQNLFDKVGVSNRFELAIVFSNLVPDAVSSEWASPLQ
jgi:DNA-binding NarL/FixJ family response regulator